jgi:hypothetical protein
MNGRGAEVGGGCWRREGLDIADRSGDGCVGAAEGRTDGIIGAATGGGG